MTMSFDTSWDIEEYRTKFECEEHWGLKRDFMLKYKDTFPEERLACLAQCFVNIELMRCRYPNAVMRQIAELAKDVSSQYRKSRKNLLQRTFVKASDAANAKVKAEKKTRIENKPERQKVNFIGFNQSSISSEVSVKQNVTQFVKSQKRSIMDRLGPKQAEELEPDPVRKKKNYGNNFANRNCVDEVTMQRGNNLPLSDVIILYHAYIPCGLSKPYQVLQTSVSKSKKVLFQEYFEFEGEIKCRLSVSGILIGESIGCDEKNAKFKASILGLEYLNERCYTLKMLKRQSSDTAVILLDDIDDTAFPQSEEKLITPPDNLHRRKSTKASKAAKDDKCISDDNIGSKLLRIMGWTGGGLGKEGAGIVEPVKAIETINRRGLGAEVVNKEGLGVKGAEASPLFVSNVRKELIEFCSSVRNDDLIFSEELSNAQREKIHTLVRKEFRDTLQTKSQGKRGVNRKIAVSRNFGSKGAMLDNLLQNGGKTDKYEVYLPGTTDIVQECLGDEEDL